MKYLSFIAVLFYLSLQFPTAGISASGSKVDLQQANKNFTVAQLVSGSYSTLDSAESSNDDDKGSVCRNGLEFQSAQISFYQPPQIQFNKVQQRCYPARAPPVRLS